jgi:glucose-6-phosphate dehydrogenase assembly protein OpcA
MSAAGSAAPPVLVRDLEQVEAELARLWQATVSATDAGTARPVLRAASLNLVTVAPTEADCRRAAEVLAEVMADQPGRVLILWVDRTAAAERLEAWVAMFCRAVGDGSQVCGEQVIVAAQGAAVDRLGGAVEALLLPECPTLVWWRGGPGPGASFLDRLAPLAHAVLFDGASFELRALPRWAERITADGDTRAVGDLAWRRGAAWRGWTADCFEPDALRPQLAALTRVVVEHGDGGEVVALLHVAWLAARLGWTASPGLARGAGGSWTGRLGRRDGAVTVDVRPVTGPSGLAAVRLEAEASAVRCVVARQNPDAVLIEVGQGDAVLQRRVVRQREPDEAALLERWLADPRRDGLYARALRRLAEITA